MSAKNTPKGPVSPRHCIETGKNVPEGGNSPVTAFFDTVVPSLRRLLEAAPAHGVCGIDCHFKGGVLVRVTTKTETSALTGEVTSDAR